MKFSTDSTEFYRALDAVSGALPSKADKDILECILLKRQGDLLELQATDTDLAIQHRFPVQFSSEAGSELDLIAVPAEQLVESCRTLPEIPITFEVTKNYSILLSHAHGKYDWMGFRGDSFPDLPLISEPQCMKFSREDLRIGFSLVGFSITKDISRPGMMGVLFDVMEGSARIVATDGHRLARCIYKTYEGLEDMSALAPPKVFQQVTRIEGPDECMIQISENHISFDFGETHVISRLINSSFPNYERVIPSENDKVVSVNREEILNSVRRVNFFASLNSNQIVLDCKDDQIKVNAWDIERSTKGAETVACEYNGDPTQIGFNAQYLQDLLRNLPTEEITLAMGTPNRAALLRPVPQNDHVNLTYLIMPVMLNQID